MVIVAALRRARAEGVDEARCLRRLVREKAKQQPIVASGKTFVAHDGVVTAVVSRFDQPGDQLVLCSHELIEMADLGRHRKEGWSLPKDGRELLGVIFADEYATERLREEIAHQLGWPFADTHDEMALVDLADQIQEAMPTRGTTRRQSTSGPTGRRSPGCGRWPAPDGSRARRRRRRSVLVEASDDRQRLGAGGAARSPSSTTSRNSIETS